MIHVYRNVFYELHVYMYLVWENKSPIHVLWSDRVKVFTQHIFFIWFFCINYC